MNEELAVRSTPTAPPRPMATVPLASERVIINSPMSFAGAAQRSWRITGWAPGAWQLALVPLAVLVMLTWWTAIAVWYGLLFGLLWFVMIPYRLLRRGARKRKAEALRHRELLTTIERQQGR